MEKIFKIRKLGVCRTGQLDAGTAFTYYELKAGLEIRNSDLPLNFILFVLKGGMDVSCNEFENRLLQSGEMIFLLRSSAVYMRTLKKTKLYVMHFDTLLSSCDRQLFKAYLPDTEKAVYDFSPVPVPLPVQAFLEQMLYFQEQKVDCVHFNNLKHREFFLLLRRFCPRADIVAFLSPLISNSMNFRNKVLQKYSRLESGRVTEFADLVGMGRKNFDKRFREEFGTSPAKWIQQETAKRLRLYLAEPDVTISDAMDKFHFNSPSHFNRFCRRYFDKSPGAMIKDAQDLKAMKSKKTKAARPTFRT